MRLHAQPRGSSSGRHDRSDRGDTLVEVLMGLMVLSITTVGLIVAFGTSLSASVEHRHLAANDIALRSAAEQALSQIQQQNNPLYQSCAAALPYYSAHVTFSVTGYTATFTGVTYWDAATADFVGSPCTNGAPELVALEVTNNATLTHLSTSFVVDARGQFNPSALTVTGVSPSSLGAGATNQYLSVTGTGFVPGSAVTFANSGVNVISTRWVSDTALVVKVSVAGSAPTGAGSITVTNPSSAAATSGNIFTVTGALTVTSVSPSSLAQGASNQTLTLTGTGFVNTPTVSFSGSGVNVISTTFTSATTLSVVVSVSNSAGSGTRTITVTNPDSSNATSGPIFTVDATSSVMDVNLMIGSYDGTSKKNWDAIVTIDVVDSNDNALPGVIVTGTWDINQSTFTTTCITNNTGSCKVEDGVSLNLGTTDKSATFTVSNISLAGYTYNVSGNFASPASAKVSQP